MSSKLGRRSRSKTGTTRNELAEVINRIITERPLRRSADIRPD